MWWGAFDQGCQRVIGVCLPPPAALSQAGALEPGLHHQYHAPLPPRTWTAAARCRRRAPPRLPPRSAAAAPAAQPAQFAKSNVQHLNRPLSRDLQALMPCKSVQKHLQSSVAQDKVFAATLKTSIGLSEWQLVCKYDIAPGMVKPGAVVPTCARSSLGRGSAFFGTPVSPAPGPSPPG